MVEQPIHDHSSSSDVDRRVAARERELNQLAIELSRQSQQLSDRDAEITEREAEFHRNQCRFVETNEQVATAWQARRELAEEFVRQQAIWQEWNSTYRRSIAHLKTQLESVERRRMIVQDDVARLESKRAEIHTMQRDCDNERRALAHERAQVTKELAELQSRRRAFEDECRQTVAEMLAAAHQSERGRMELGVGLSTQTRLVEPVEVVSDESDIEVTTRHSYSSRIEQSDPMVETVAELSDIPLFNETIPSAPIETESITCAPELALDLAASSAVFTEQTDVRSPISSIAFAELPDDISHAVLAHCQNGDEFVRSERDDDALDQYAAAWELLPNPKNQWQAATSILIAAIDIFFAKQDFVAAREILREFVESTDTEVNPAIVLRFGESLFETGHFDAAYDVLEAVCRINGEALFADEDPKYLDFVKTQMIAMAPVRSPVSSSPINPPHRVALMDHSISEH